MKRTIPFKSLNDLIEEKAAALREQERQIAPPVLTSDQIAFTDLLDNAKVILHREVWQLNGESKMGKLSKDSAQALRDYIKLLNELSEKEKDSTNDMSEEQLKAIANEDKQIPST